MATRLVVLADRILGPLRSSDPSRYRHAAEAATLAESRFQLPPIVLLNFRREVLLDCFPDCLFLIVPERLCPRAPATYAHCLRYVAREDDLLLLEADAIASSETFAPSHLSSSGMFYTGSAAAPDARLVNYYIRATDRPKFERAVRSSGASLAAMRAILETQLPVLSEPPAEAMGHRAQQLTGAAIYDQQ